MRIGELARRTGLTVETLRFYERAGVLGNVTRDASGYRVYDEQTYRTVVGVRWGQELGLRLEDIAGILTQKDADPTTQIANLRRTVDERLAALQVEIEQRRRTIASLETLRDAPFEGECMMPSAFVDELVRAHEHKQSLGIDAEVALPRTRRDHGARGGR